MGHEDDLAVRLFGGAADDGVAEEVGVGVWRKSLGDGQLFKGDIDGTYGWGTGHEIAVEDAALAKLDAEGSPALDAGGFGELEHAHLLKRLRGVAGGGVGSGLAEALDVGFDLGEFAGRVGGMFGREGELVSGERLGGFAESLAYLRQVVPDGEVGAVEPGGGEEGLRFRGFVLLEEDPAEGVPRGGQQIGFGKGLTVGLGESPLG